MNEIDYNAYMSTALQRMIGDILSMVAEEGLPGKHHFYITFNTRAKGVVLPPNLKAQFPEEMTIVLQEWFDNLGVMDDRFCVTLSFSGRPENLVIPFDAISAFSDPSANFSLRFEEAEIPDYPELDQEGDALDDADQSVDHDAEVIQFSDFKKTH